MRHALRFAGALLLPCLAGGFGVFGGCGGDAFQPGGGDGSTGDGTTGDGSGSGGDGSPAVDAVTKDAVDGPASGNGPTVYVAPAPMGSDTHTGLSPTDPVKSIVKGLLVASTLRDAGNVVPNVLVCAGDYAEDSLIVGFDVVLSGGWDCTTHPARWQQAPNYGFPSFAAGSTSVVSSIVGVGGATLAILGAVSSAATVDGFVIQAPTKPGKMSIGVDVAGSATLSNLAVDGGSGAASASDPYGSMGMYIHATAASEVKGFTVSGGSGSGPSGSVGLFVDTTGGASIHDGIVTGGTGQATAASAPPSSVGIQIHAAISKPLSQLIVSGSDVTGGSGFTTGIFVNGAGASVQIEQSVIAGGWSTAGKTIGISVDDPAADVTVEGCRVWGGFAGSTAIGVLVSNAHGISVANSIVHAGEVSQTAPIAYAVGVDLANLATSPILVFDTIYTGGWKGTAIALNPGVSGAQISDDLLLGSGNVTTFGVAAQSAAAATDCHGFIATLDHTAFVNLGNLYQCVSSVGTLDNVTLAMLYSDGANTNASLDAVLTADCSVEGASTCATYSACPSMSPNQCLGALFGGSWSSGDDGACSALGTCAADAGVPANGWTPATPSPCALTAGGAPMTSYPTDVYGKTRTDPPTIGAVQVPGSSCADM